MKRILSIAASAALAVSGLALTTTTASADFECRGTISNRTIDDNVKVPAGASCTLSNVTVKGNVQAEENAPVSLTVTNSRVDGDIQVKYARTAVTVSGTTVGGNIQVVEGRSAIALSSNVVGGDIQVFKNSTGAKSIVGNRVDGNLQCKENSPAPTGHSNVVRGSAEDQCRGLTGSGGGGGSSAPALPPGADIYSTPGTWTHNGRTWRTSCAPYSQTQRCTTDTIATVISYRNGRYVKSNDWAFNNLTYLASPRSLWKTNPLGAYGVRGGTARWTASDGRQWRTECDTALTGQRGCRSFATATVIEQTRTGYRRVNKEIFNNMVRFTD